MNLKEIIRQTLFTFLYPLINKEIVDQYHKKIKIFGDPKNLILNGDNIILNNAFFNCQSGFITIHSHVGIAHNCMIITGTHDFQQFNKKRSDAILSDRNIVIEEGAFIGSGTIILGPCTIGKNTVIGAGSVVVNDVEPNVVAVGNPCRVIKKIN